MWNKSYLSTRATKAPIPNTRRLFIILLRVKKSMNDDDVNYDNNEDIDQHDDNDVGDDGNEHNACYGNTDNILLCVRGSKMQKINWSSSPPQ